MSQSHTATIDRLGLEGVLGTAHERSDRSGGHYQHDGERSNDHLVSIYDEHDQFEAVVPFIQRGLERDERCLYVADDNTTDEVMDTLREGGIDVAAARDSGALSIHTKTDIFLRTGEFDQEAVLDFWQETLAEAQDDEGYAGLRIAIEMTWALDEWTDFDQLIEYEAAGNTICVNADIVALCQYNRERFPAAVLSDVFRTHPLVISDRTVYQNHHYLSPETFFETDYPSLDVDQTEERLAARSRAKYALQEIGILTDEKEFTAALNTVLRAAHENDIELAHNSYACRNEPLYPDWDITITRIQKPPETPDEESVATTLTDEERVTTTLTDEETVAAALNVVLRAAHENDIELAHNSYACRNEPLYPDWDITITRVHKPSERPIND